MEILSKTIKIPSKITNPTDTLVCFKRWMEAANNYFYIEYKRKD